MVDPAREPIAWAAHSFFELRKLARVGAQWLGGGWGILRSPKNGLLLKGFNFRGFMSPKDPLLIKLA